ncbi:MAG: thioredoxin domain-containing protein, partial [Magnetococcales bacterium]|nr:thioredoxin domain-containing protein [Magnetococcales bacterium]
YKSREQGALSRVNHEVMERISAPVKGAVDAKVTVVEFFDPACGACSHFYPITTQLIKKYPGKIRVMLRYAPLHQGSKQVVKMLEAAHSQGKFWQALELLFDNQQNWVIDHVSQPMRALALLNALGIDREKLAEDMNSAEIAKRVQKDIDDGRAINVRATPEFYVNGRPLPSFGAKQLFLMVDEAVSDLY